MSVESANEAAQIDSHNPVKNGKEFAISSRDAISFITRGSARNAAAIDIWHSPMIRFAQHGKFRRILPRHTPSPSDASQPSRRGPPRTPSAMRPGDATASPRNCSAAPAQVNAIVSPGSHTNRMPTPLMAARLLKTHPKISINRPPGWSINGLVPGNLCRQNGWYRQPACHPTIRPPDLPSDPVQRNIPAGTES